mgnify:FL=1
MIRNQKRAHRIARRSMGWYENTPASSDPTAGVCKTVDQSLCVVF